uniref:Uncharacterized protein n=1 Tax=Anopheles farauti TaxID=69004 RepID=A0A182QBT6_9DIPT
MLEKEPDSMAVTMKQDYAASEVYSTTSEAPPPTLRSAILAPASASGNERSNKGKGLAEKVEAPNKESKVEVKKAFGNASWAGANGVWNRPKPILREVTTGTRNKTCKSVHQQAVL